VFVVAPGNVVPPRVRVANLDPAFLAERLETVVEESTAVQLDNRNERATITASPKSFDPKARFGMDTSGK
jgi:hypothetical protein